MRTATQLIDQPSAVDALLAAHRDEMVRQTCGSTLCPVLKLLSCGVCLKHLCPTQHGAPWAVEGREYMSQVPCPARLSSSLLKTIGCPHSPPSMPPSKSSKNGTYITKLRAPSLTCAYVPCMRYHLLFLQQIMPTSASPTLTLSSPANDFISALSDNSGRCTERDRGVFERRE